MTRRPGGDDEEEDVFRWKREQTRADEFAAAARQLQREREAARPLVERVLRCTPRDQWPALSERSDLQTAGALECLGNLFAAILTKDPLEAMAIAELTVGAAEGVDPGAYLHPIVAQLRAHAWKDLGKALRFLGRNAEALDAFDKAETQAEQHPALVHDRAIVLFNRVMSLQELSRFDESQTLLAECRQVFDDYGDTRNVILCGLAEGILFQRLQRHREARETYLLLFASAKDMDTETRAALHRAIGLCSIELGDFREGELNLKHAVELNETLGQRMEAIKTERCIGILYIRRGEVERGLEHLRPIRREFLRNGLSEEAGLCGLDIVEGLLVLGRTSTAETLARRLVSEFMTARLSHRAIGALGHLTEAITANRASTALVTKVREYIVSLRTAPERDFVTPS